MSATPPTPPFPPDTNLPARIIPSPNHGPRPAGRAPDMLILHYTGMASAEAACTWLCEPRSGVSAHYLIDETGAITQMVPEVRRAWHAGTSYWAGERDLNNCSIGIEIHNVGHDADYPPFPAAQMRAVAALSRDILGRWTIPPERVLAHSDIALGRKIDPGELFDWGWLASEGVGLWIAPAPTQGDRGWARGKQGEEVRAFQAALRQFGYEIAATGAYDAWTECVVSAFQRHFRPKRVDGHADRSTRKTLARLIGARF